MRERGFYFAASQRKQRTFELYRRMQRELLSCEACSEAELRGFIRNRKLMRVYAGLLHPKPSLVSFLESADAEMVFPKFVELPAELREVIYGLHFEDISEMLPSAPQQPPVTRVSRQIRRESLPLSYSTCTLKIWVDQAEFLLWRLTSISATIENLLQHTPYAMFRRIKSLRVVTSVCNLGQHGQYYTLTEWVIRMGGVTESVKLIAKDRPQFWDRTENDAYGQWVEGITASFVGVVGGIMARRGKAGLKHGDIRDVAKAFVRVEGH